MNFYKVNIDESLIELYGDSLSLFKDDKSYGYNVLIFNSDLNELADKWNKISSSISMIYQADIEAEFEKWNLYIIYICSNIVPKELKSKIENDKYSSRKIVVGNINEELTENIINCIIKKHITHSDLIDIIDNTVTKLEEIYVPNDLNFWSKIPTNKLVSGNLELQKNIIKQLKACCNENY
jgi:hypothetical protein